MAKFVVTGGAGFIGSHIVFELINQGHKVKVIDNLSTGSKKNLNDTLKKIKFVRGDICNIKLLQKEFRGFDYVLHQAAISSVAYSIKDPAKINQNNVTGTLNVLLAAKTNKIKKVVCASSASVYGDLKAEIKDEKLGVALLSPYALTKYADELYCRLFYQLYSLPTICLRYFNVFGPRQDPQSEYAAVIPRFITTMIKGRRPTIYGNGRQSRDFIYVKNVALANILAATSAKGLGQTVNIAGGQSINLKQLIEQINLQLNKKIKPIFKAKKPGDVFSSQADISLAKKLIKYKVLVKFSKGLEETIEWYRKN